MKRSTTTMFACLLLLWAAQPVRSEVTVLQNGVAPAAAYQGCRDTWISDEQYEKNQDHGKQDTLRTGGKRHALVEFDLVPLPREHVIHKAVLRLAVVGYPRKEKGSQFNAELFVYCLTRAWNTNAGWSEHTRGKDRNTPGEPWANPGGDYDAKIDFGRGQPGVVGSGILTDGPRGHTFELDVTAAVERWHSGKLPNHGLLLMGKPIDLAGSRWYVPGYRPQLLVDHGPKGSQPAGIKPLRPAETEITELDPVAATPDRGQAQGEYAPVRVGQNSNCELRGESTDAYLKEAVERFPGTWGWMTECRVGGRAGDFSRALLRFDLREIPKTASIQKAVLRLSLTPYTNQQAANCRYGAFLMDLPWDAATVTSQQASAGQTWPKGGVVANSHAQPVAVGKVVTAQVERRGQKQTAPVAIEFDLTGAVRAWVEGAVPNHGIVLDNRIEGGACDFHSSRSFRPELRPYLEITLSPAIARKADPIVVEPALPTGDYWVEPMREVHKQFHGTPGTLSQYGDSITVTMAFLAGHAWGKIEPKNCTAEVRAKLDRIEAYANRKLWIEWKEAQYGNTGMMMSDWLIKNIDGWQKRMNAEAAVVLFGTNDLGKILPPEYTENMAASLRRMMADGTVPMLTTVPPKAGADDMARDMWLAHVSIAHALKVPVIDFYGEIMRRRPDDWNGRLEKFSQYKDYDVPAPIARDGTHPSNPKQYQNDFSEEALSHNGYNLRNYLTLRMCGQIIAKVFQP